MAIYCLVLLADVAMLVYYRGIHNGLNIIAGGINVPKAITTGKKKFRQKWEKTKRRLISEDEKEYKIAVIEADQEIEALLRGLKYSGSNLGEILEGIPSGQLRGVEEARLAHEVHNRIIHDETLVLSRQEAREAIEKYEKILEFFDIL